MGKDKLIGTIIGVIFFILLIAGITYAYVTWTGNVLDDYKVSSKCFNVLYEKGNDITGTMMPSLDYSDGLFTSVKMNIDSNCNINARGKIYLNTLTSTSDNLLDSNRNGLLNYQVLKNGVLTGYKGTITSEGSIEIDVGMLSKDTTASTEYTIYVWVNNDLVQNSDAYSVYYGSITAEAVQYG